MTALGATRVDQDTSQPVLVVRSRVGGRLQRVSPKVYLQGKLEVVIDFTPYKSLIVPVEALEGHHQQVGKAVEEGFGARSDLLPQVLAVVHVIALE